MTPGVFVLLGALLCVQGCASARMSDRESDNLFRSAKYDEAASQLEKGLKDQGENGRDLLLYLLDLGLALHSAGRYEESNQVLLKADKVAEIKDYTSLAAESASILTSENVKDYKGEDFENVLISTYLAMNYALMGDVENALVEARRVNRKLHMMITEGKRKYKQNAFARYLSAILYESEGNFNDAYIDYKKAWELEPDFPALRLDLWRTSRLSGMRDEAARWDGQFQLASAEKQQLKPKAEIIVFYENGISPVKRPNPDFHMVPRFYPRPNPVSYAHVEINGQMKGDTAVLDPIETTAIRNLEEKYAGIVAKRVAGLVAKRVVADQIERKTNSPLLGALARATLYLSDQADLRSWNLLPKDLQIARFPVEPGTYEVKVTPVGADPLPAKTIQVRAGKKVFVNFRYMP